MTWEADLPARLEFVAALTDIDVVHTVAVASAVMSSSRVRMATE
jgi:hypothetical protein